MNHVKQGIVLCKCTKKKPGVMCCSIYGCSGIADYDHCQSSRLQSQSLRFMLKKKLRVRPSMLVLHGHAVDSHLTTFTLHIFFFNAVNGLWTSFFFDGFGQIVFQRKKFHRFGMFYPQGWRLKKLIRSRRVVLFHIVSKRVKSHY